MTWTPSGSILLKTDWQYTEPIAGSYFKLKHSSFPVNSSYLLAQAQANPDGSVELTDIQEFQASNEESVIYLKAPPVFSDRRLAIKRIAKQPSFASELRRIIRADLLQDSDIEFSSRRLNWTVEIGYSDYIEPLPTTTSGGGTTTGGDEFFDNVVLLMHFEGANDSVVFTDVLGHPFTVNGAAKISTLQSKFGTASGSFPGNGTITTPDSEDWNLAAGDFTIEASVFCTGLDAYSSPIVSQAHRGDVAGNSWNFLLEPNSNLAFGISTTGSNDIGVSSGVPVPANLWVHVAVTREAGILRFWIDGIKAGVDTTRSDAFFSSSMPLAIGGTAFATDQGTEFIGFIDELRITKGVARYTTNFTPPTAPFPDN